ncbi:hypothetical protein [Paenibacillus sp. GCM10023250]|uniref:hypothetical protein n=1 Tax=Paenibacillus sp. GCM10023250 TaxID=3252648 RepID=UPI0036132A7F
MSKRYRITREMQGNGESITLEECKRYFADKPDFDYAPEYTVHGSATMTIPGEFFLWRVGAAVIPFRHYQGNLYVSGTNEAVIPKMMDVAADLRADVVEG